MINDFSETWRFTNYLYQNKISKYGVVIATK